MIISHPKHAAARLLFCSSQDVSLKLYYTEKKLKISFFIYNLL
jgi:hypothetical protein